VARVIAVSCFVTNSAGDVLLVRSEGRSWECPGGTVDEGESLLAGLAREVREEAGVEIEVDRLAGIYVDVDPHRIVFLFRGSWLSGDPTPSAETPECGWFPPHEATAKVPAGPHALRLADALANHDRPLYREYRLGPPLEVLRTRSI
jgi:8-oxo-dGTP diphosphatase